jgi:hypothetical protein
MNSKRKISRFGPIKPKSAPLKRLLKKQAIKTIVKKDISNEINPTLNLLLRGITSGVGNVMLPGGVGSLGGDFIGNSAHKMFKQITGYGDYKVHDNTIVTDSVPSFIKESRGTRVYHREYIKDIFSDPQTVGKFFDNSNGYNAQGYINPGNVVLFPWLSKIAMNYEQFYIHGMVFEFKTTSGDALTSTNTALGSVIMATQYNSNALPFFDKRTMENYEYSVSTVPSISVIHPIECSPAETPVRLLYVRNSNINYVPASDRRLYDLGNFTIATSGFQGVNVNCGELWVTYDIEFFKPIQPKNVTGFYHLASSVFNASNPFGTTVATPVAYPSYMSSYISISGSVITFAANFTSNVLITYTATASSAQPFTVVGSSGATALPLYETDTQSIFDASNGTNMVCLSAFSIVNGGVVTFSGGTLTTPTLMDLFIVAGDLNF